eukprot:gnl/TRDRNA2_/TRDRNA2_183570_c0_seq1.p1 gnl/TRDRNA2_/TRDRNA2_183570_c0~~gnl/TRDRNA2_/TRDRNA2_183570_c0_seq1.p1  ORF type:complete len:254 (+),score=69.48 gnl/TRDRNA2_/TRDRNA2_183570_c0_seq1:143-904(+)
MSNAGALDAVTGDIIQTLGQLHRAHENEETGQRSMYETLSGRMMNLDERLSSSMDASTKKWFLLKDTVLDFEKQLERTTEQKKNMQDKKEKEIQRTNDMLMQKLLDEQDGRRQTEMKILSVFEDKTSLLREEVARANKLQEENEQHLRRYLEQDVPKLYESIREEVEAREEMERRMLKGAMEEVMSLQKAIIAERNAREDSEEAMLRMMEDVVGKMQQEISDERRERQRTEDMLMTLLTETCGKLELSTQGIM